MEDKEAAASLVEQIEDPPKFGGPAYSHPSIRSCRIGEELARYMAETVDAEAGKVQRQETSQTRFWKTLPPGRRGMSGGLVSPSKNPSSHSRARSKSGEIVCIELQPQSSATIASSSVLTVMSPTGV